MLDPGIRAALEAEASQLAELERRMADPEVAARAQETRRLAREAGRLQKRVGRYRELVALERRVQDAEQLAGSEDRDLAALAEDELAVLAPGLESLEEALKRDVLARDELSDRNVILEVRAGTGGDEATLFVADLARMYHRFCERKGFRWEEISSHRSEVGGFKELIVSIEGDSVYDHLRFESGGHRVQRVPSTEAQGRIHTSAATVAVLPEPEEVEIRIQDSDLKIDAFRAGGPGGQNVNKTSSAVRVTHLPTGMVVICQDESSQHKNKSKALRTLRSRLFEQQQREQKMARDSTRRSQIGTGDRSEKIRTYNFPQDRITDHRIKESFHNLPSVLDGELDDIVDALKQHEIEERLKALGAGAPGMKESGRDE